MASIWRLRPLKEEVCGKRVSSFRKVDRKSSLRSARMESDEDTALNTTGALLSWRTDKREEACPTGKNYRKRLQGFIRH